MNKFFAKNIKTGKVYPVMKKTFDELTDKFAQAVKQELKNGIDEETAPNIAELKLVIVPSTEKSFTSNLAARKAKGEKFTPAQLSKHGLKPADLK